MTRETQIGVLALAVTATLFAAPAAAQMAAAPAQIPTMQTTLANDVGNLGDKFTGLARVMAGKYDWRPMAGVRSVGDVLNLIVTENRMLAGILTGAAPAGRGGGMGATPIADATALQEALKTSSAALKEAVSKMSAADLTASASIFGQNTTKQGAILIVLLDQHEHLGQSIAYARSNSVVPPWSK